MTTNPAGLSTGTAAATVWARPRTTPDGDLMPGEDAAHGQAEVGFWDMLDVINPLQHLPVVGTIYRAITGDTIGETARMAGGALYGGPLGLIGALANLVVERETGKDIGGTAMAWLSDDPEGGAGTTTLAAGEDLPETAAQPINAAPVTVAASHASPDAQPGRNTPRTTPLQADAAVAGPAAVPGSPEDRAAGATTTFEGRSADRLDAFIRQASAVRRDNPLAAANPRPGAADAARQRPVVLAAQESAPPTHAVSAKSENPELALAGGDAGSVSQWMMRALDKYEHMRKQEQS